MNFKSWLTSFAPSPLHATFAEKLRSGIAGGLAIFILAWALHALSQPQYPLLLLGSMAASAVLLYALPASPLAQPWSLVGGHLSCALCGWMSSAYIGDPQLAAGIAVGGALFLMFVLNCLHPPGAATALTLVLSASQFQQMGLLRATLVVVTNVSILLLLALLINNALPRRIYPHLPTIHAPLSPLAKQVFILPEQIDLEWALAQEDYTLDINVEELTEIYWRAQQSAQARYQQLSSNKSSGQTAART